MTDIAQHTNDCQAADRKISILRGLLVVTRWTLIIAMMFVLAGIVIGTDASITLGADPQDPDAEGRKAYFGVFFDEDTSLGGFRATSLVAFVSGIFGIFAISQILNILGNVSSGHPFVFENGTYLRRIGFAGAVAQLSIYAIWIGAGVIATLTGISFSGMTVQLSPAPWIGVLIAYSLSTIFRQGAEMKQEQDPTV